MNDLRFLVGGLPEYTAPRVSQVDDLDGLKSEIADKPFRTAHGSQNPIEVATEWRKVVPNKESARSDPIPDKLGVEIDIFLIMGRIDKNHADALDLRGQLPASRVGIVLDHVLDPSFPVEGLYVLLGDEVRDHLASGQVVLLRQDIHRVASQTGHEIAG